MPTYEYACQRCGHRFEKFQAMSDPPVRTCPSCRSRRVKRLIGAGAGLLFKGSGFYATDYRDSSYKEAARKEKEAASGAGDGQGKEAKKARGSKAKKPASEKRGGKSGG